MRPARPALAVAVLLAAAWFAHAAWRLVTAAHRGTFPNAVAGDVIQSGAALVLVAAPFLWIVRREHARTGDPASVWARWSVLGVAVLFAGLVALTMLLGQPWRGFPAFTSGGLLLIAAIVAACVGIHLGQIACLAPGLGVLTATWTAHAVRLVNAAEASHQVGTAVVSYAIPQAIALAPLAVLILAEAGELLAWRQPRPGPAATGS